MIDIAEEIRRRAEDAAGPDPYWKTVLSNAIDDLNKKYFVASMHGATVIASVELDHALERERLVFSKEQDLRLLFANRHFVVEVKEQGGEVRKPLGHLWLTHPERRTYERISLIPRGDVPPDTYNLWRGFGVEAAVGSWDAIRYHLLNVICSGDETIYRWLLRWIARCVQHPELRAEVAVVLRGLRGVGKGALATMLLKLFGNHGLAISNSRHLVGNFNSHLVDVLLLFLDEAFWAGDKAGEGTLKALITEPHMVIEPKGINAFPVPNRLKIIMASNSDWVVPATADERRYFVLDVSEAHRGDAAYFKGLFAAIEGDELPAFLDYLLTMALSDFDHRHAPHTDALNRQKLVGGDSLTKFWLDCLTHGEIVTTSRNGDDEGMSKIEGWPKDIVAQDFHQRYVEYAQRHGNRHPVSDAETGKKMGDMVPGLQRKRPRRPWRGQEKPTRYFLPDLETCRETFLVHMDIASHIWPTIEEESI